MKFIKNNANSISITARIFIALIGGFILSNLVAIIISYLPADNKVDGIMTGMMLSFIAYTIVVMVVFSTKTAKKSAISITGCCLIACSIITYLDMAVSL